MVRATSLALLALVPSALASSSFGSLNSFSKRQQLGADSTEQVQGLLTLAQQVLKDQQSGNITEACTSWAGSLIGCEGSAGSNQVELASCACGSDILTQLDSCASAYGETGTSAASGFESFCTNTLPSIAQNPSTTTVGGGSSSVASSAASSASAVASGISSSVSSIISQASSIASSVSASASPSPSSGGSSSGTSGASKNGGVIGAGAGLFALLATLLI
ncbi:hypothetical protein JCM5353_006445 [Sporobolomyces roseus]